MAPLPSSRRHRMSRQPAKSRACADVTCQVKTLMMRFRRIAAFGALLGLVGNGTGMAFDIEAHRGGRALFPENTLPAFANALSMGVDTLELDMGVTHDGVIVISHERGLNPDLARSADGGYVAPP